MGKNKNVLKNPIFWIFIGIIVLILVGVIVFFSMNGNSGNGLNLPSRDQQMDITTQSTSDCSSSFCGSTSRTVECQDDGDTISDDKCDSSTKPATEEICNGCDVDHTNLLLSSSYNKAIFDINCVSVDDIVACMQNKDVTVDKRDLPSSCALLDDGVTMVCSRNECLPASTHYKNDSVNNPGCIVPGNKNYMWTDDNYDNTYNASAFYRGYYTKDKAFPSVTAPYIPIIEGTLTAGGDDGMNLNTGISQGSLPKGDYYADYPLVALPVHGNNNQAILLMPFKLRNFHPYLLWINNQSCNGDCTITYENESIGANFFQLNHMGTDTYVNSRWLYSRSSDGGIAGKVYMLYNDASGATPTCGIQAERNDQKCFSFNVWDDSSNRGGPNGITNNDSNVNVKNSAPERNPDGSGNINYYSNNWNVPVNDTGDNNKQQVIYFGSPPKRSAVIAHRNTDNEKQYSHMRMMAVDYGNSGFWSYINTDWVINYDSDGWRDVRFCAPIQYGISYYEAFNGKETTGYLLGQNFSLEAYTWDDDYTKYVGLGMVGGTYGTQLVTNQSFLVGVNNIDKTLKNGTILYKMGGSFLSYKSGSNGKYEIAWAGDAIWVYFNDVGMLYTKAIDGSTLYLTYMSGTLFWLNIDLYKSSTFTIPMWALSWVDESPYMPSCNDVKPEGSTDSACN